MADDWWTALTEDQQKQYLKEHPRSKRKIIKRKGASAPKNGLSGSTRVAAHNYIDKNAERIGKSMIPTINSMKSNLHRNLKEMPKKEADNFAKAIKSAIVLKDHPALRRIAKNIGIRSGVLLIGVVGLTALTGVDLTLAIPLITSNFWSQIRDAPDSMDYLKNTYDAYIEELRSAAGNPEKLKKALTVDEEPSVVIDDEDEKETAGIVVTSHHETDLNKLMLKIERLEVAAQTDSIIDAIDGNGHKTELPLASVNKLIRHREMLESVIPSIASIFVASISQRKSLASRARTQMSIFNREIAKCRKELARCAKKKSPKIQTPLIMLLKRRIKAEKVATELSYIRCEDRNIHPCEIHTFTNVEVASTTRNKIDVYGYMAHGQLNVAVAFDSDFAPKAFTQVKPNEISRWLKENGVI